MDYLLEVYNGTSGASISNNFNRTTSWGITIEDNYPPGGAVPHTGVVGQWKIFVDRIQNNGPSPVTARDGTFATALVLKSFESIRAGQPIVIDL